MQIHWANQQILVKDKKGKVFRAAISHAEENGEHTIALATSARHREQLRQGVQSLTELIARQHRIRKNQICCYLCTQQGYAQSVGGQSRQRGRLTMGQMERLFGKDGTPRLTQNPALDKTQESAFPQESMTPESGAEPDAAQREDQPIRPRIRL